MFELWLILAFWMFLLGMAWYPCCDGAAVDCSNCQTATGTDPMSVYIDVTDGDCACSWMDGTWALPFVGQIGYMCQWVRTESVTDLCAGSDYFTSWTITARLDDLSGPPLSSYSWSGKIDYNRDNQPPAPLIQWGTAGFGSTPLDCGATYQLSWSALQPQTDCGINDYFKINP